MVFLAEGGGKMYFVSKICLVSFEIISYQFDKMSHKIMTICLIQIGFADDFRRSGKIPKTDLEKLT